MNVSPIIATDTLESSMGQRFEVGDEIVAIDNQTFAQLDEMTAYIQAHPGEEVVVKVHRNNQEVLITRTVLTVE